MTEDATDPELGAGYDPKSDTYHARFDPDTPESLAGAVIYLVSVAIEKEPEAMDPLFEVVDADALDKLFHGREARTSGVEFRFCGCEVTAVSDGEVRVTDTPGDE